MINGEFVTATIAITGTTSAVANLGRAYEKLLINIPTIDSAQVGLQVSETTGGTYRALHFYKPEAATSGQWLTSAGTGGIIVICNELGGFQFVKVTTSAAQNTAAVTFRLCGVRN